MLAEDIVGVLYWVMPSEDRENLACNGCIKNFFNSRGQICDTCNEND
jgi:hypothetical protein